MEYKEIAGKLPEKVFTYFQELSDIPRGSGNTKAVSDYCVEFAKKRGLSCRQDTANNVVIVKEASEGCEAAPTVMLQGHLDMVCNKEEGVDHDFLTDSIKLVLDGDYLRADGTTLGGDDGIAAAFMLAVLDSKELVHPRLECVFTADEEIGMVGASALDMSGLRAKYLLNLDSEEEGIFLSGCAGGIRYDLKVPVFYEKTTGRAVTVSLSGLTGGHSGVDIEKGRANAILLLGRILSELLEAVPGLSLLGAAGGAQDNAIPGAASVTVLLREGEEEVVRKRGKELEAELKREFHKTDSGLALKTEVGAFVTEIPAMEPEEARRLSAFLMNLPNGVQAMSQDLPGLVETSLSCGILSVSEEGARVSCLLRSSSSSGKRALQRKVEAYAGLAGGSYETSGDYPAWEYLPVSLLQSVLCRTYEELYGTKARVETIHAGVECGLFASAVPGLDAVSMGPEILDIHTPKERLSLSSTDRFWRFLTEVLKRLSQA